MINSCECSLCRVDRVEKNRRENKALADHVTKWATVNATMDVLRRQGEPSDVYTVLTVLNCLVTFDGAKKPLAEYTETY